MASPSPPSCRYANTLDVPFGFDEHLLERIAPGHADAAVVVQALDRGTAR